MAIQQLPAWIGSQAVAETGQQWMSAARPVVHLPSTGWMSEMAGKSKWNLVMVPATGNGGAGVSSGEGSFLNNTSGLDVHSIVGYWGVYPAEDMPYPMYVSVFNLNVNGVQMIVEGYKGNQVFSLPNRGWVNVGGANAYGIDWEGEDFGWWLDARVGQHINVYLKAY